jgi:hypothetical protein
MRRFQFWLLVAASSLVSLLMIKQIFLSRALNHEQGILLDSEETASTAQTYETAWQKLAMAIYESSRQDPGFASVLKQSDVEIHTKATTNSGEPTLDDSTPGPSTPPKAPFTP